ncbi:RNA polymerase sigma factor [Nocardiopsis salina]|uniref:RNA polymerase sigma factor n=1 Tax=Nocardiopsis salina TaxID=245836 RepID=UPI00036BAD31|nr:sigma-70 family RNA polymerase sigma factor [Nocardiopsis salina]
MAARTLVDERALVLRAQDGDVAAFEVLVDRHQGRLFRIAYMVLHNRMDAEDVVQEALVSSWKRLHLLEEPSAFRNWVTQIASRAATNVVRKAARRSTEGVDQQALEDAGPESALGGATSRNVGQPERAALAGAQMEALASILQSTEENQRTCWVLCEIDGMSYREIAQMVGVSESTVRGRIARARSQILDRMKDWR